jgi:hypothetical protein
LNSLEAERSIDHNRWESTMTIELCWASGSPFSWRAMLALEVKKVAYTGHLMEFSKGEIRTPERAFVWRSRRGGQGGQNAPGTAAD